MLEKCPYCKHDVVVTCDPFPPGSDEEAYLDDVAEVEHLACTSCDFVAFTPEQAKKLQKALQNQAGRRQMGMEDCAHIACDVLGIDETTARRNWKKVPEIDGYHFWNPERGGSSLLVNSAGEKLTAASAVSLEKHLEAFLAGKRS